MNSSRVFILVVTVLLCQFLSEIECRRTTTTSRRGSSSSRRTNTQGSSIFNFFNKKNPSSSSSSSSSSSIGKKSSTGWGSSQAAKPQSGWISASQAAKSQQSGWIPAGQVSKTQTGHANPSWANPNYSPSAPKQTNYGWVPANKKPETNVNQFQKSGQQSSNIGPGGYPVQSGVQPQMHGFNTAQQPHGFHPPPQTHGYNSPPQSHGFGSAQQPHAYNPAPQSHGYNTNYQPPPSYGHPSYPTGNNFGGYHPTNNFGNQGFASSHGISPNHYPSQSNFGYPGQGLFGGSHGPKYGGLGLFGGSSGNFGYGGNSWGVPTYGTKKSSGTGKLLTGLAVGAAGGYLTSSLVNRISNPWGYSGFGYGSRFGYDRPIIIKEIRETTKTETPANPPAAPAEPDPTEKWIQCVVFDPTTNTTLINPNCSCTVTTVIDPMTGLPISTHNCTAANGQVFPPQPVGMPVQPVPVGPMDGMPPNAVNNPNASPSYVGLYQDNFRYGGAAISETGDAAAPPIPKVIASEAQSGTTLLTDTESAISSTTESSGSTTMKMDTSTSEASSALMNDSPQAQVVSPKVKEFYSQLEQIVSMGKFQ